MRGGVRGRRRCSPGASRCCGRARCHARAAGACSGIASRSLLARRRGGAGGRGRHPRAPVPLRLAPVARLQPSSRAPSHAGSHFTDVGSGRYDFWRVSLDAFVAHPDRRPRPGQLRRLLRHAPPHRTRSRAGPTASRCGCSPTPAWSASCCSRCSWSRRAALAAVARAPAPGRPLARSVAAGAALLPLVVWLIHGSVDWFWEMPALTGPALGFLAHGRRRWSRDRRRPRPRREPRHRARAPRSGRRDAAMPGCWPARSACSRCWRRWSCSDSRTCRCARCRSASDLAPATPPRRFSDLQPIAADLESAERRPGRLAGDDRAADRRQLRRRPGALRSRRSTAIPAAGMRWLGAGLAASALGDRGAGAPRLRDRRLDQPRQPP